MNHFESYSFLSLYFQEAFIVSPKKHWANQENRAFPVLRNLESSKGNRPVINQVNATLLGIHRSSYKGGPANSI